MPIARPEFPTHLPAFRTINMTTSGSDSLSIIIGGSSGMGLATARLLVAAGNTVLLVGRDEDKLALVKGELSSAKKGGVETVASDLYVRQSVNALIARIDAEKRHISHLVNSAGFFIP